VPAGPGHQGAPAVQPQQVTGPDRRSFQWQPIEVEAPDHGVGQAVDGQPAGTRHVVGRLRLI
jgi:hypothetical protein